MDKNFNRLQQISESIQYKIDLFVQSIKQWIMTLVNEASIGLFQIQEHLRDCTVLLRQNKGELERFSKKTHITIQQQEATIEELKTIGILNKQWATRMQMLIDKLQTKSQ